MKTIKNLVVSQTTPSQLCLLSSERPFRLDEYFSVKGDSGNVVCRIIETSEKSKYFVEEELLSELGLDLKSSKDVLYIGMAKVEQEEFIPISIHQEATELDKEQVNKILTPTPLEKGLVLGEINGSEDSFNSCDNEYKNLFMMLRNEEFLDQTKVPFVLNYYDFHRFPHIGLFGGSGSGKSYALKVILEELLSKNIPNIILDPHLEMSFDNANPEIMKRSSFGLTNQAFKSRYEVFNVGKDIGIKFTDLTTDELCTLILFKGDLSQPMLSLMKDIHDPGDTSVRVNEKIRVLSFFKELEENKKEINIKDHDGMEYNYYISMKSKIPSYATIRALEWRFKALMDEQVFNSDVSMAERAIKERKSIVIRGSNKHLNMLGSYLFKKFYQSRRNYVDNKSYGHFDSSPFPPFIITVDEAHIFAPQGNQLSPTKNILKTIAQEGRKYGVFEIAATQRPQLLDETIVAQLSTKIILRTNISQDLEVISKETNLSNEEVNRLPYLDSGNAFISSAITKNTVSIRFRANFTTAKEDSHPFDDLDQFSTSSPLKDWAINQLPISLENIEEKALLAKKDLNDKTISRVSLMDCLEDMSATGLVKKEKSIFGFVYDK